MIMREFDPGRGVAAAAIMLAACLALIPSALGQAVPLAQSSSPANAAAYEVISVKSSKRGCGVMSLNSSPGRLTIRCYQLRRLLFIAYSIRLVAAIPGMPGWGDSAPFDIDAKADEATTDAMNKLTEREQGNQTHLMIQAILADRFKLRVHTETRKGPVYNLVIAKGGLKLKPTHEGDQPGGYYSWGSGRIQVRGGLIASLAYCLSEGLADRTVIDRTGLTANYDIDLHWTPDDQESTPDAGPTLFTALEEQLGLKLVPSKGPIDTFVIDHVEKPSEN